MIQRFFFLTLFLLLFHPLNTHSSQDIVPASIQNPGPTYKMTFQDFLAQHGNSSIVRSMMPLNVEYRRVVFYDNLFEINQHNSNSTRTYNAKVNEFAILTPKEASAIYLSTKQSSRRNLQVQQPEQGKFLTLSKNQLASTLVVNYQCLGKNVGHQGFCKASPIFAASDTIALILAGKNGIYLRLSAQFLINFMVEKCDGSTLHSPFQFIVQTGIPFQMHCMYKSSLPLIAHPSGDDCFESPRIKPIKSWRRISGCENILEVLQHKPVAVGIYLSNKFLFYDSSIMEIPKMNPNYAVVLVGYHRDYGFRIKASFGVTWGQQGFAWIDKQLNGNICSQAVEVHIKDFDESLGDKCKPSIPQN